MLICSYRDQEFVRIGYYVNNEYDTPEMNSEPPEKPIVEKLVRNILQDKPRVTKVPILWDTNSEKGVCKEEQPDNYINEETSLHVDEIVN